MLQSETGWTREEGYVDDMGYWEGESEYEDYKVISLTTVKDCDTLFITIRP